MASAPLVDNKVVQPVRVRYAPSPTGYPHLGNIRTALFNWLFARHYGGSFIVRIEDTDMTRKVEGAIEEILNSLRWLGLYWDEGPELGGNFGPYFQSQRLEKYHQVAQTLVSEGCAYFCYCSADRLKVMREKQTRSGYFTGYDRHCRDLNEEERFEFESKGIVPVVRFKMPLQGKTAFEDLIRGRVEFENGLLDDFVLLKSDGFPTYHLANIIDDHFMEISHVLRADEWLSSTPKHVLLYQAIGWKPPLFAHLPMILGPDKAKLSKRHGATSVTEFRDEGYLPQAMLNFMALLGWSIDDKTEIFACDELIKNFSIERVSKTAAIFDHQKLYWMNGFYIRELKLEELLKQIMPVLESDLPAQVKRPVPEDYVKDIIPLIRERINTLKEAATYADFFFLDKLEYDPSLLVGKKMEPQTTLLALKAVLSRLSDIDFKHDTLENALRVLVEEIGLKAGSLFMSIRIACTGRSASPGLFETMTVLGKERCLKRIEVAISNLESM